MFKFSCSVFYLFIFIFFSYSPCELFETVVSLLTSSTLMLNFDVHLQLLRLSSQLFIGGCDIPKEKLFHGKFLRKFSEN